MPDLLILHSNIYYMILAGSMQFHTESHYFHVKYFIILPPNNTLICQFLSPTLQTAQDIKLFTIYNPRKDWITRLSYSSSRPLNI